MFIEKLKNKLSARMRVPIEEKRLNSMVNRRFLSSIGLDSGLFLDCGCGRGENIRDIEEALGQGFTIVGMDVHYPTALECKENVAGTADIICANALDTALRDGCVDTVLSNQVIEHIAGYERYMSEIARILRPGGYLVISTPNAHCPRNTFLKTIGQKPILRWSNTGKLAPDRFRGHVQEFTEEELLRLIKKHGFTLIENRPILPRPTFHGNWIFNIYRLLEYLFYLVSRPFVDKGYSKNSNMLFKLARD